MTSAMNLENRTAVINAGIAPGLTNLLVRQAAELLEHIETVYIRLRHTEADLGPKNAQRQHRCLRGRPSAETAGRPCQSSVISDQ